MENSEKFWMVKAEGDNATRCVHQSRESAAAEAERLAKRNIGVKFYILEAIAVCSADIPVKWE